MSVHRGTPPSGDRAWSGSQRRVLRRAREAQLNGACPPTTGLGIPSPFERPAVCLCGFALRRHDIPAVHGRRPSRYEFGPASRRNRRMP